jgi:hypothetical protein
MEASSAPDFRTVRNNGGAYPSAEIRLDKLRTGVDVDRTGEG